jgi:SSS family solute:Na+ symporter
VPNPTVVDWLMPTLYLFFAISIGYGLRPSVTTSAAFTQAGRTMPAWLCALAFLGAGVGSEQVIVMGAAGAHYGLASIPFYCLGAVPALLFTGLFMMPLYYGSKARSTPEFLRLRFDEKTRALNAVLFAAVTVFAAGISLYATARLIQALHVFDAAFNRLHLGPDGSLIVTMALPAAVVLLYILLSGLAGAMYNQGMQFCLLMAGFLPIVFLGLKKIGGWRGLKAIAPMAAYLHAWNGAAGSAHSLGIGAIGLAAGLGMVFGAGYWCTDFRVLQTAMAAEDTNAARRAPLIAASAMIVLPLVLILPSVIASGLPTPRTTIIVSQSNGSIYHQITVVPPAVAEGQGLVPAKAEPATGKPIRDASGRVVLDYEMAMPAVLVHFLPTGLLGLGLTALLACLMSGLGAGIMAFSTVFTCDLYQAYMRKDAEDRHLLAAGKWAAAGAILLALGIACTIIRFTGMVDAVVLLFAILEAPQLSTFLLGMFWKRATGHGAFAGLAAGAAAAILHYGLTLPAAAQPGWSGGWITVLHRYPDGLARAFCTAIIAFGVSFIVTVAVSLCTQPRPEAELAGLVHSLTPRPPGDETWWKQPEALAAGILVAAMVVSVIFG